MVKLCLLESYVVEAHYVGITRNIDQRLESHNKGKVKSTRGKKPWVVIYTEEFDSYKSARAREKYLKSYKGAGEKREIIKEHTKYFGE